MAALDGKKEILVSTDPGTGINPDAGYIYKWVEQVGAEYFYKYKDENGNVGNIGTTNTSDANAIHDNIAGEIAAITEKTTPVDADLLIIEDSEDSNNKKKLQLGNIEDKQWEEYGEGIRPKVNNEVNIGRPGDGRELVAGEGDSYNQTGELYVKTFNGSTYNDVTSDIQTVGDSNELEFAAVTAGNIIYFASRILSSGEHIQHFGVKALITTAATLGAGDIVFEYWNGSAWTEFNHMVTQSVKPFTHYANEKLERTGDYQIRYDQQIVQDWAKTNVDGDELYWVRWRIDTGISVSPSIDFLKLHSNRAEFNSDGFIEYFGSARPIKKLAVSYGSFQASNASPANSDVYLSDNVSKGYVENLFQNGTVDRSGLNQIAPLDLDTGSKLKVVFKFFPDDNTSGDVEFTIRWAASTASSVLYQSTAAPTTAPGEKNLTSTYTIPAGQDGVQQSVSIPVDFPTVLLDNGTDEADLIWISFQRTGNAAADTYSGDIVIVDIGVYYHAWSEGGHSSSF